MERIRFYFDPRCPWCYLTSRWACRLEELGEISIDWAVFCLEVVNRAEGVDPLTIEARSGPALRTAMLLRERSGRDAVGDLYHALGTRVWESELPIEVDDLDGIRDSLKDIGADPSLLDEALADHGTWDAVVQEHEALVEPHRRVRCADDRARRRRRPRDLRTRHLRRSGRRQDGRAVASHHWLVRYGNFAELKRGRGGLPELPAMEYRVRQYAERGGQRASR